MFINNLGHMTKMAAMSIYGKNPSKIFYSGTGGLISKKFRMKHRWLKSGWPRTLENRENRENDEKKFPAGKNQGI